MLNQLLSGDFPRSRVLSVVLVAILVALALAPFIFPGTRSLNVAAKVAVFVLLVASYDLLLGYTGIVSFAHTMFFGIGGYGVGIAMAKLGPGLGRARARLRRRARALSLALALAIGLLVLARARDLLRHDHARGRLVLPDPRLAALARSPAARTASRFRLPELLRAIAWSSYYMVFGVALALFLVLLRVVNSPFGRVLLSIRENEFRAEGARLPHVTYRTVANCLAALGGHRRRASCTRSGCATPGPIPRFPSTS